VWTAANPAFAGDTEMNLTQFNPLPASTSTVSVPVLITRPNNTATFPAPWKTVIFQHGITRNRTDMLAVADSFAAVGFAVVAIDMPMHGVTGDEVQGPDDPAPGMPSPIVQFKTANERTFDLDIDPVSLGAGGLPQTTQDGKIDSSGTHFINLANLRNTRDNVRQSVADLFAVMAAIPAMDLGGDSLDAGNVYFLGHSLGAIVGTPFTALETNLKDAVFAFGGGAVPKVLDGSASFGPVIAAGLGANGIVKGTDTFEAFLLAAQTTVDSGDPINYGAAAAANHNILYFEIAGGGGSPSDLVVPNRVPDANDTSGTVPSPLAGTEPLVGPAAMNLTPTKTSGASGDLLVRFNAGHHGSLLTANNTSGVPSVVMSAEVFAEIQSEFRSYIGSGTATLTITDPDLLKAP
jgi:pimeloyl-ACP methyl ester carboxylesterase